MQRSVRFSPTLPIVAVSLVASIGAGTAIVLCDTVPYFILGLGSATLLAFLLKWFILPTSGDAQDCAEVSKGFLVALGLRIAFAFVFHGLLVVTDWKRYEIFFFDDEPYFDQIGWALAQDWHRGEFVWLDQGTYPFVYFVAAIYYLYGHQPLLVRIFNAALGAVI